MKRSFDIIFSALLICVVFPFGVLIALIIKMTSPGPVFFVQQRVGRYCQTFEMYKFRTMVQGAEQIGGFQTRQNDPRITPIGRVLRRSSLDELPQLLNVIIGDMSVLGPRPNVMEQKIFYKEHDWNERHSIRPGITGLAQVKCRSKCSFEERLAYDLEYVRTNKIGSDLKLIINTVKSLTDFKNVN